MVYRDEAGLGTFDLFDKGDVGSAQSTCGLAAAMFSTFTAITS